MITKPKKKETKTYLALIVIGIALVLGCPNSGGLSDPVTESVPAADATDFPANGNIVLTYSGTVVKGTGNITFTPATGQPATLAVTDAGVTLVANDAVDASTGVAGKPATTTVTINPATNLAVGKTTLAVPAGAFKVDIPQGSNVAGYSFDFTTIAADDTAPTIMTRVPAHLANDVAIDASVVLTFSEPVYKGTGNITFAQSAGDPTNVVVDVTSSEVTIDGAVVTIKPTGGFKTATIYNVQIEANAFTDYANANGNVVDGSLLNSDYNFVTAAAAPGS